MGGKVQTERVVEFKKANDEEQIVYGEVYIPDKKDSDGNWMTTATVRKMAHSFMEKLRLSKINKGHSGAKDKGTVVESFIARKDDPDFAEDAWVVGVHVPDVKVWKQVKDGTLTGFSIEGSAMLVEEEAE